MEYEMKKCVIIGSAPLENDQIFTEIDLSDSFVVCADGGVDAALRNHITPNLIVGDFDSLQGELPENIETIKLSVEKDDTDMMAAIRIALKRGFRDFVLLGAIGGRMDHSYANLCALQFLASQGCKAVLAGQGCRIFLLNGGRLTLQKLKGSTVSVFPFGAPSCTVSYGGLKYPLVNFCLTADNPLGVSNEIIDENAWIAVHSGNALIFVLF
jgi:thiamine pyrophosphokinase